MMGMRVISKENCEYGEQRISWGNLISNKGCIYCSKESTFTKLSKTPEQFKAELNSLDNRYLIKSLYVGCSKKVDIFCPDCNTDFSSKAGHLLSGHKGCSCSSKSLGEDKVKFFLDSHSIKYAQQYRIANCKNKKPLPFDFAILSEPNDILFLIEFNGKQHYDAYGFGSTKITPQEQLEYIQRNDAIKQKYCFDNHINLIIIPYWEINNIDQILSPLVGIIEPITC